MNSLDYSFIVPGQYTGKEVKAEASTEFTNNTDALIFYKEAEQRLLDVNNWHKIAGFISAVFQVIDLNGNEVKRSVQKNDYIRIDIPGPGSKEGDGYDWVYVEELAQVQDGINEACGLRVRPSENPMGDKTKTAHFYTSEATSSFIISRIENKVSSVIIDRNIKPNDEPKSLTDKLRHTAVGIMAISSFSKLQWQHLANSFVEKKE